MPKQEFQDELTHLINRHSMENGSNTPDFMLAEYLSGCLDLWNATLRSREDWYSQGTQPTPCPALDDHTSTEPTDHPRAFTEAILDYTPTILKSGNGLSIEFDIPDQADEAHDLLWHAINSVKSASTEEE